MQEDTTELYKFLAKNEKDNNNKIREGAFVVAAGTGKLLQGLSKVKDPYGANVVAGLIATLFQNVLLAEANRKQLGALATRVATVIPFLERISQTRCQQNVKDALTAFADVLQQCIVQARKFSKKNFAMKVIKAGTDQSKFIDLNTRLNETIGQLDLGLSIEATIMLEQNMKDSLADKREIIQNVNEVLVCQKQALENEFSIQNQQRELMLAQQERDTVLAAQLQSMYAMLAEKLELAAKEKNDFLITEFSKLRQEQRFSQITLEPSIPKPPIDARLLIPLHEITVQQKIAQGSFGSIYCGIWCEIPVVIKKACGPASKKEDYEQFVREVNIMSQLRNPYVTQFYGACLEPDAFLVMEYMEQGSLEKWLDGRKLSVEQKRNLALDIAKGLLYLHTREVLHRDLKTANILINAQGQAKLTDFGLSKTADHQVKTIMERSQAIQWMAPETFLIKGNYLLESDIYSYGMVLWSICTGKKPFAGLSENEMITRILGEDIEPGERIDNDIPLEFQEIIKACWCKSPGDRPSLLEIVNKLNAMKFQKELSAEELCEQGQQLESKKDFTSAAQCYNSSANLGFFRGMTNYATCLLNGTGVPQDKVAAFKLMLESAQQYNHGRAQYNVARMYEKGDGVDKNPEKALYWYQEASKQNVLEAKRKVQELQKQAPQNRDFGQANRR